MHKKVNCGVLHLFLLHNLVIRFVVHFTLRKEKKKENRKNSIQVLVYLTYVMPSFFSYTSVLLLYFSGDTLFQQLQFYVDTIKQMAIHQLVAGSPLRTLCLLIAGQPAEVFSADTTNLPAAITMSQQPTQVRLILELSLWWVCLHHTMHNCTLFVSLELFFFPSYYKLCVL